MITEFYTVARNRLEALETVAVAVNGTASFLVSNNLAAIQERKKLMAELDRRFQDPIFKVTLTAEPVSE